MKWRKIINFFLYTQKTIEKVLLLKLACFYMFVRTKKIVYEFSLLGIKIKYQLIKLAVSVNEVCCVDFFVVCSYLLF